MAGVKVSVERMPLLDEPGWTAWWVSDDASECIEWRYGKSLRVIMSIMGVSIDGSASFTTPDEVGAYERVMRIATRGVMVIRRRHEAAQARDHNRAPATTVAGDEEPHKVTVVGLAAVTAMCEIH